MDESKPNIPNRTYLRGVNKSLKEVFNAILELHAHTKDWRILIKDIVEYLNKDKEPFERYTNKEVAKLVLALGLHKEHSMKGKVALWNDRIIERLRLEYGT